MGFNITPVSANVVAHDGSTLLSLYGVPFISFLKASQPPGACKASAAKF